MSVPSRSPQLYQLLASVALFTAVLLVGSAFALDETQAADDAGPLPALLEITWSKGPNLPQGFQDSDGGFFGSTLVTVGGFCSGRAEDERRKPGRYPRGFLRKAWALGVDEEPGEWTRLPDFPGAARQGLASARVGDALYFWGGFSYTAPYCYANGWRLRRGRADGQWRWDALPSLPWKLTSFGMTVLGSKIYACGGADYDAQAFYTASDRDGKLERLGARFLMLDTKDLAAGWKELPSCPGTPRWVHAVESAGGRIYVLGGATGNFEKDGRSYGYCTVVDNWAFDPATREWSRLQDLPISSGNFPKSTNLVFKDRYIVLPGGHQYAWVAGPDGSVRPKYGGASSFRKESGLHNDVFVYDTKKDIFGRATPLPIDNNLPMSVVRGDTLFLLGGETGGGEVLGEYYGHHPELVLKGRLREIER